MDTDQTIPFSLHTLYNIVKLRQIWSSVYHKLLKMLLINQSDKHLNLSVDLGLIRLFVLMLFITV